MAFGKQGYRLARVALAVGGAGLAVAVGCVQVLGLDAPYAKATDGASGGSSGSMSGGSSSSGESCAQICSSDLKQVMDCKGQKVVDCTPDEGCYNARCEANPCDVAAKTKTSVGCDYWALKTAQRIQLSGACFAVLVANTWGKPARLTVSYGTQPLKPESFAYIYHANSGNIDYQSYNASNGIPTGETAVLFLSRASGAAAQCPKTSALENIETGVLASNGTIHAGTGKGTAFHIITDYPTSAYQVGAYSTDRSHSSASLLLPTSIWSTNYIAVNAYKATTADNGGWPSLNVLAYQDNTAVTILPKADIQGGGAIPGAAKSTPTQYTLKAGDFLQITQAEELTGSPIQSDKPVAFFGASDCMNVPTDKLYCNFASQQMAPVQAIGNEYVAVRYRNRIAGREESVPWRFIGMTDNTTLTWTPEAPSGAPQTLKLGQIAEFSTATPFVVKSQDKEHPFYLGAYMTGGADFGKIGDPAWVNVIPPVQFLDSYVFSTEPTFSETSLVVVRTKSPNEGNFAPVMLDCLGKAIDGWVRLGDYEYTRVDLVTGNFQSVGGCTHGRQALHSALPFGVTVWGWSAIAKREYASYAYPAGAGFRPLNDVVIPTTP
jgi:IgGFc binding protein